MSPTAGRRKFCLLPVAAGAAAPVTAAAAQPDGCKLEGVVTFKLKIYRKSNTSNKSMTLKRAPCAFNQGMAVECDEGNRRRTIKILQWL
jgi:hypothetical protein